MIELVDLQPKVEVQQAEYQRLLGYPRDMLLEDRAAELAKMARTWYSARGRPWVYARAAKNVTLFKDHVKIDGVEFQSSHFSSMLTNADADSLFLTAASAGPELEQYAQQLWREEKPDEYFFLEVFGSAVVEHLITMKGAELCAWAEQREMAVLPHYSPGYPTWDVAQQPALLRLINDDGKIALPGQLEVFETGMLKPKKSLLAVFGLTRARERVGRLTDLNPCERCPFLPCQYRRAPYLRAPSRIGVAEIAQTSRFVDEMPPADNTLLQQANYSVNRRALSRWAVDRLQLRRHPNGTTDALFRYEGTTCSNMGRPLFFDYQVTLGPRENGYIIYSQSCRPSPGEDGYMSMCQYLENAGHLMSAIDQEKPLLGEPLNRVLNWGGDKSTAGCYCELADRMHKWRIVLETIHYALVNQPAN